jgi:hypothetical protein
MKDAMGHGSNNRGGKVASGALNASQVMYHVAPVNNREEIDTSGIAPRPRPLGYGPGQSGTFLYPRLDQAQRWAQVRGGRDIYEVRHGGLNLEPDTELADAGAMVTHDHIATNRLRRL